MTALQDETAGPRSPGLGRSSGLHALLALVLLALAAWAALLVQSWRVGEAVWIDVLCRPALGAQQPDTAGLIGAWAAAAALWMLMSTAMMLPTAVPMLASYGEATALRRRRTGERAPSTLILALGYLGVWLAVSVGAALAQVLAARLGAAVALPRNLGGILAGMAVGLAGLYQFSEWKLACLSFCRHDVPAEIAERGPGSVLRAGIGQGLRCLGCCGPVMALMLLAGFMNLFWMAGFALLMTVEKLTDGLLVPRLVGAGLVALGLMLAVQSVGTAAVLAWLAR